MLNLDAPVRSATLAAQVASQVEALIVSGEWPVGTRIPPENALVSRLGVSRNTVREALRSLVHTGMLEARPGDGTYVRAFSELQMPLMRRVRRARLSEAVEVRSLLEQQAAKLAAARRRDEDVVALRALLARQREASRSGDKSLYAEADAELHRAVVACADNAFLADIYDHIGGALKLSVSPELWDRALAVEEVALHQDLVESIAAGDEARAEAAAGRLVETLRDALLPPEATPAKSQAKSARKRSAARRM